MLDMGHLLLLRKSQHKFEDLFVRRDIAADATEKLDWACAVQRQPNIIEHLSVAHFDDDEGMGALCEPLEVRQWGMDTA